MLTNPNLFTATVDVLKVNVLTQSSISAQCSRRALGNGGSEAAWDLAPKNIERLKQHSGFRAWAEVQVGTPPEDRHPFQKHEHSRRAASTGSASCRSASRNRERD